MANTDFLNDTFGKITGSKEYDTHGYHCTRCDYELDQVALKTTMEGMRKIFFCRNSNCERYGLYVAVAKKKAKAV